ncbi:hypothetical protein HY086_00655 [Candidatus Gottesmanbacteria bacterium]|nr:hypothetical protein [Candidatus Gottesmanbacteria bacterium]
MVKQEHPTSFFNLLFQAMGALIVGLTLAVIPVHAATNQPNPSLLGNARVNWIDGGGFQLGIKCAIDPTKPECGGNNTSLEPEVSGILSSVALGVARGITGCTGSELICDPKDLKYQADTNQRSMVYYLNTMVGTLYDTPPANLALFIDDGMRTLGLLPKSAYAQSQGVGFSGLAPILPIWKAFRNIAYAVLAIAMIVVGFMVMLRKKIDPKTVVTVQNALPRIVVTLLLITFSYAIVGLLIDLMYVIIAMGVAIFKGAGLLPSLSLFGFGLGPSVKLPGTPTSPEQVFLTGDLFTYFGYLTDPLRLYQAILLLFSGGLGAGIGQNLQQAGQAFGSGQVGPGLGQLLGAAGNLGLFGLGALLSPFLVLLVGLMFIFVFVRLFFVALTAYIQILLAVIVGPLQLLTEAFPGGGGFEGWIKNLIANLAVFPIMAFMGLISLAFSTFSLAFNNAGNTNIWTPPYSLGWGGNAQSVAALFSIGALMMIPNVISQVKETLKAKAPAGAGFGAALAPFTGTISAGLSVGQQFFYGYQGLETVRGIFDPSRKKDHKSG